MFSKVQNNVIKFSDRYFFMKFVAKYKTKRVEGSKVLTSKRMLPRLPIAVSQVKVDNTSENLPNKTLQIIYSLYRAKAIAKKVYNYVMSLIMV